MTTDTISIEVFFRSSTSGKLYAGTADSDGKFTGALVKDGKLVRPVREHMNGTLVANVAGDPIEQDGTAALPFSRYVTLNGNPMGQIPMNQFLEAMAKAEATAAASKADEKPGE